MFQFLHLRPTRGGFVVVLTLLAAARPLDFTGESFPLTVTSGIEAQGETTEAETAALRRLPVPARPWRVPRPRGVARSPRGRYPVHPSRLPRRRERSSSPCSRGGARGGEEARESRGPGRKSTEPVLVSTSVAMAAEQSREEGGLLAGGGRCGYRGSGTEGGRGLLRGGGEEGEEALAEAGGADTDSALGGVAIASHKLFALASLER